MKEKFNSLLFRISAITILISTITYLFERSVSPYFFAVAAAGMAISKLNQKYEGNNLRLKRLYRMQKMTGILYVAASYFMFKPHNQWVPLLLTAALLELYSSFVIIKETEKK